jgi:hypothetical protein
MSSRLLVGFGRLWSATGEPEGQAVCCLSAFRFEFFFQPLLRFANFTKFTKFWRKSSKMSIRFKFCQLNLFTKIIWEMGNGTQNVQENNLGPLPPRQCETTDICLVLVPWNHCKFKIFKFRRNFRTRISFLVPHRNPVISRISSKISTKFVSQLPH